MNKKISKNLYIALAILFILSISIFIFSSIYQGVLPKIVEEINNSSIGAILTAIITVLLLSQQSSSEEIKERNVRVFEEKSERFNSFINKLWEIWDDRSVSLEELNELIKIVSRDIILYTKPETVDNILTNLIEIADHAKPDKTNNKDENVTKLIQNNIFNIVNDLAKEIDLGGEIKPEIKDKLNTLEHKVIPYLIQKNFKINYIDNFRETLLNDETIIDITNIEYKNKYLWCQLKNSNVYVRIGSLEREKSHHITIGIYVEFWANRKYQKYRDAARGWRKDFLFGTITYYDYNDIINFNDYEKISNEFQRMSNNQDEKNELAVIVINLLKKSIVNGKNIEEIIDECN